MPLFGLILLAAAAAEWSAFQGSQKWPTVEGGVIASYDSDCGEDGPCKRIDYKYEAGGVSHVSSEVGTFLVGESVKVHVDPADPGHAYVAANPYINMFCGSLSFAILYFVFGGLNLLTITFQRLVKLSSKRDMST
jgi:hypothetical protein